MIPNKVANIGGIDILTSEFMPPDTVMMIDNRLIASAIFGIGEEYMRSLNNAGAAMAQSGLTLDKFNQELEKIRKMKALNITLTVAPPKPKPPLNLRKNLLVRTRQ